MFSILVLILMSSQIDCQSICDTITPNGVFNGLQIYRKYESNEKSHLIMNDRNGIEWLFDIQFDEQYSFNMNDSMANTNVSAIYRFGNFIKDSQSYNFENCMIFLRNESLLEMKCYNDSDFIDSKLLSFDEYVIFNTKALTDRYYSNAVLLFRRKDKSLQYIHFHRVMLSIDCGSDKVFCGQQIPEFVKQMDDTLFTQLEGVEELESNDEKVRYFLLFRIDVRPKFCVTLGEELSTECKSSEYLIPLFSECFNESTEDTTDHIIGEKHHINVTLVLVVIGLLVLAVIIALGILFMNYRNRQKIRQFLESSLYTSEDSIKQNKIEK